MHASFCSDLVKRRLLLNTLIRSSFGWFCCWYIVGWRTLVSNTLHSYSKCRQQGLSHLLPITIKCLHCKANITLQFTTVKGRDREGQTLIMHRLWSSGMQFGRQVPIQQWRCRQQLPAKHWYLSIELCGVTSQMYHCCENFSVRNLLQNQNLITVNTATKLNLHD